MTCEVFDRTGVAARRLVLAARVEPLLRALGVILGGSHGLYRKPAACDLSQTRVQPILGAHRISVGFGLIQLQKRVSRLDGLAFLNVDCRDLALIEQLDHLGVASRLDLARRRRVNVQPAEIRPDQRRKRAGADRRNERDRQRRGRRLQDFKRSRQEFVVTARDRGERRSGRLGRRRLRRRRGALVHAGALTLA